METFGHESQSLTPWLTGTGARSAEGTNSGHKNAEGMPAVGVRVEPPVRLGSEGTVLQLPFALVAQGFHMRSVMNGLEGTMHLVSRFLEAHRWTVAFLQPPNGVASRIAYYGRSPVCKTARDLRGTQVPIEVRPRSEALCIA